MADDGHSHYGNVFRRFAERYGGDIDARSTVIVMGDARNNYREPGLAAFRELAGGPAASTGSTRSQGTTGTRPTRSSRPMVLPATACSRSARCAS